MGFYSYCTNDHSSDGIVIFKTVNKSSRSSEKNINILFLYFLFKTTDGKLLIVSITQSLDNLLIIIFHILFPCNFSEKAV
jgi:hypothetical protein